MKVAIFGVSGQLGRDVATLVSGRDGVAHDVISHEVVSIDHARADIRDPASVAQALRTSRPDWVVNCATMTHVDRCETEALPAFEVNALGAANVASGAAACGARILHLSTDYVFDGNTSRAYVESDPPRPINIYGMSKLAGEWAVRAENAGACVVRSSGLYGHHVCRGKGTNFVETMLARAASGPLRVVADETLTPTLTGDLARQIVAMIERGVAPGIYHATNAGACSWFEFAQEIVRLAGMDTRVEPIRAADWKAAARRPANSVLENRALASLGFDPMPDWRDALARYMEQRADTPTRGRIPG